MKQNPTELKGEKANATIIGRDFDILLSIADRATR